MIVLDASALVEVLLSSPPGLRVADRITESGGDLQAPALIDVEILHALKRLVRQDVIDTRWAGVALDALKVFPMERVDHGLLLDRAWALRHSISSYDAMYVALAEVLGARLFTLDARLASAHGHRATIEYLGR